MAQALPLILAALAGFALVLVLTALWQSMRLVLQGGAHDGSTRAKLAATGGAPNRRAVARDALLHEKATLLQAIRDVRFEHDLGKVSDVDLERLDAQYRVRARAVLAELDAQIAPFRDKARALLGLSEGGLSEGGLSEAGLSEAGVSGSITSVAAVSPVLPTSVEAVGACAACATVNDVDAVFCKKCGARMASEAAS